MTSELRSRKGLKRYDSIHVEVTKPGPPPSRIPRRSELVHKAEVHDSRTRLVGSSGEETRIINREPSRQQVRRRHRRPRKGSETDTLSEVESGGSGTEPPRQDTQDTSDRSSHSQTLVVPSGYHARRNVPFNIQSMSSVETSSTSHDYTALPKTRVREPRRGSLTDTLSEATDSESTVAAAVPKAPPRPSLDTTGDSQELHSQESIDQLIPPPRVKKLRRKRRGGGEENGRETDDASSAADQQSDATESVLHHQLLTQGEEKVVVHISSCDSLRFLDFCRCPAVRLHIVDPTTGEYKASIRGNGQGISPLETQPFNMKLHRSVRPIWEEDLVVEEPSSVVATKQSLLLFEIFDFVKGNTVAWAFLKLVATNGATNLGKPLRLQLFKPPRTPKPTPPNAPKCYGWWSKGKYSQYKSTLYISVNSLITTTDNRDIQSPTSHQKLPVESTSVQQDGEEVVEEEEVIWARYPGQSCKLPNAKVEERDSGKDGVLCLAFSHEGKLLAVPASNGIILYTVPSARIYLTLDKHQGLIYDVAWSEDDDYLVSASADATACLWHIKKRITRPIKVLAHPSYVYCCCWVTPDLFASGCSDGVVRVWSVSDRSGALNDCGEDSSTPVEFLAQHSTRVNSLASACRPPPETQRSESTIEDLPSQYILISADNIGIIIVWHYNSDSRKFELEREVKVKDLRSQVISRVVIVAKRGESATRLLVQSRDSIVRLIDLQTSSVLQIYQGGYLVKSKVGGCQLCGCSRRVWSASEDSSLIAWDYATGERVATYSVARPSPHSLPTLALHPLDHILAYTFHSPSDHPPLHILQFDKEADDSGVGLVIQEAGRRRGALQWSALDSPLYEVPPVRLQPPPRLKAPPTPATPSSRLSPAPTPVPRTTRRFSGEGSKLTLESVAKQVSSSKGEIKKNNGDSSAKFLNKSKLKTEREIIPVAHEENSTAISRDSRLSDIIGKMDLILIQAQPATTVK